MNETPIVKAVFDSTKLESVEWNAIYSVKVGMSYTINFLKRQRIKCL